MAAFGRNCVHIARWFRSQVSLPQISLDDRQMGTEQRLRGG